MLTRAGFEARFARRAVFGMIHLAPLPGSPRYDSMDAVLSAALSDARALAVGGADGMVFENFGDVPFHRGAVAPATVAAMTRVICEVRSEVKLSFGVNVLRNDAAAALSIAAATGAAFIRVNIHTGTMLTDQGIIDGDAAGTLRLRRALEAETLLFADYMVKHAAPFVETPLERGLADLRERGMADAIILTGAATGAEADDALLHRCRDVSDVPIVIGSGVTAENAARFGSADAIIAGTALKEAGRTDPGRVSRLVAAFKAS